MPSKRRLNFSPANPFRLSFRFRTSILVGRNVTYRKLIYVTNICYSNKRIYKTVIFPFLCIFVFVSQSSSALQPVNTNKVIYCV